VRSAARHPDPIAWAAVAALLAPGLGACTHTYIYGGDAAPTFERGRLVVDDDDAERERFTIRRVGVSDVAQPWTFRRPTADELAQLRAGVLPDNLSTVRIDVDNSGQLWRDYGMAGFGIGATTVLALLGLSGLVDPSESGNGLSLPLTFLIASVAGLEFMVIGLGLGVGIESPETDMRFRDTY